LKLGRKERIRPVEEPAEVVVGCRRKRQKTRLDAKVSAEILEREGVAAG
jgi:hypothetical protein